MNCGQNVPLNLPNSQALPPAISKYQDKAAPRCVVKHFVAIKCCAHNPGSGPRPLACQTRSKGSRPVVSRLPEPKGKGEGEVVVGGEEEQPNKR